MLQPPPAEPGMREEEVDTPALLLDLDAFEANLDAMAALLAPTGVKLRAHAKTHKSPVIARLQMLRGAVGQCVQKVARGRGAGLGRHPRHPGQQPGGGRRQAGPAGRAGRASPRSRSASTTPRQVGEIAAAAEAAGVRIRVLVEIDCGAGRCGVAPGPAARGAGRADRRQPASPLRRAAELPRQRPAQAHARRARGGDRPCRRGHPPHGGAIEPARPGLRHRRRRRHRHLRAGGGERRLYGDPGRLLRLHGCRLRPQRQPRRRSASRCSCWRR